MAPAFTLKVKGVSRTPTSPSPSLQPPLALY